MAAQFSNMQIGFLDSVAANGYSYHADAYVLVVSGLNKSGTRGEFHFIWYAGTPTSDSGFNNAPVGSIFKDTTTTTGELYHKNATGANWTTAT